VRAATADRRERPRSDRTAMVSDGCFGHCRPGLRRLPRVRRRAILRLHVLRDQPPTASWDRVFRGFRYPNSDDSGMCRPANPTHIPSDQVVTVIPAANRFNVTTTVAICTPRPTLPMQGTATLGAWSSPGRRMPLTRSRPAPSWRKTAMKCRTGSRPSGLRPALT
jgi:hypothetical protein